MLGVSKAFSYITSLSKAFDIGPVRVYTSSVVQLVEKRLEHKPDPMNANPKKQWEVSEALKQSGCVLNLCCALCVVV